MSLGPDYVSECRLIVGSDAADSTVNSIFPLENFASTCNPCNPVGTPAPKSADGPRLFLGNKRVDLSATRREWRERSWSTGRDYRRDCGEIFLEVHSEQRCCWEIARLLVCFESNDGGFVVRIAIAESHRSADVRDCKVCLSRSIPRRQQD